MSLVRNERTAEGESFYTFNDMSLERTQSPVFAASWTVVHPIDQRSPLYQRTREQLVQEEAQIVVSVSGIDETFAQPVRARFSYEADDLVWDHRFVDMLEWQDPQLIIHLDRIHQVERLAP